MNSSLPPASNLTRSRCHPPPATQTIELSELVKATRGRPGKGLRLLPSEMIFPGLAALYAQESRCRLENRRTGLSPPERSADQKPGSVVEPGDPFHPKPGRRVSDG